MAYLELIQLLLLIGSVGVMCGAIALFLMNKERIQNYVDGFDGTKLFWCYFVLLFFFLCGYMGYLVHWIVMGMKGTDLLITCVLFFGAWFVVLTMIFIRKLFDSILFEKKNQIDALTGLLNKGASREAIEEAARSSKSCVLAIFDLDNFKQINDKLGHMEGDMVIVKIADLIHTSVREGDIVGRFGGDEFVVLMPKASLKYGVSTSENIRDKIYSYFQKTYPEISGGVSIGIFAKKDGMITTYDHMFTCADRAMYDSKQDGKNKVRVWKTE